jgi:hypothetical protein
VGLCTSVSANAFFTVRNVQRVSALCNVKRRSGTLSGTVLRLSISVHFDYGKEKWGFLL